MGRRIYINNIEVNAEIEIQVKRDLTGISSAIIRNIKYSEALRSAGILLQDMSRFIYVKIMDDSEIYFEGYGRRTSDLPININFETLFDIEIQDKKVFLSKSKEIKRLYSRIDGLTNGSVGLIIQDIFEGIIEPLGLTMGTNEIDAGDTINILNANNMTAFEALEKLGEVIGFIWYINNNQLNIIKDFNFEDKVINFNDNFIDRDIKLSYNSIDYYNSVSVSSDNIVAGISKEVPFYIEDTSISEAIYPDRIANIISAKFTAFGVDTPATFSSFEDTGSDIIWKPNSEKVKINNILGVTPCELYINYYPYLKRTISLNNDDEAGKVAEASGIENINLEFTKQRNDIQTDDDLYNYASGLLARKSIPEIVIKIKAYNNIMELGERIKFDSTGEFSTITPADMAGVYIVKAVDEKTAKGVNGELLYSVYDYELTNSYYVKTASNFYDQLQENEEAVNIEEARIETQETFNLEFKVSGSGEKFDTLTGDTLGASDSLVGGFDLNNWDTGKAVILL